MSISGLTSAMGIIAGAYGANQQNKLNKETYEQQLLAKDAEMQYKQKFYDIQRKQMDRRRSESLAQLEAMTISNGQAIQSGNGYEVYTSSKSIEGLKKHLLVIDQEMQILADKTEKHNIEMQLHNNEKMKWFNIANGALSGGVSGYQAGEVWAGMFENKPKPKTGESDNS